MINYDNIAWGIRSPSETYFIECVNVKWMLYNVEQLSQLAPRSIKMYQTVQTKNQNTREYMGYYGIVWTCMRKSSQTKKQKHLYKFERVWRGTGSDAIQDVFHLLAGTNWISLQATWYHDISWWICWYILIYVDIFQKHSLKIDIWYTLAIDIHWVEIDLYKLSWLCVFKRYRINSIHIKPNAAWCPIFIHFLHSFAQIQTSAQSDRMTCNRLISSDHTGMYRTLPQYDTIQVQWHELILQISCIVWECMRLYEMVWEYLTFSEYGHKMS